MFDRRMFLGSLAAGAVFATSGVAQPMAERYGSPAGTSPFPPEVYKERRRRLMERMGGGVAVLYGNVTLDASNPVAGMGRQDSDFAYLTGIQDEAGAALILAPRERTHKEFLFLAARNPEVELWEGERLSLGQGVRERTGFERVFRSGAIGSNILGLASRAPELHFLGPLANSDAPVPRALELYGKVTARLPGSRIVNSNGFIREMRMVKEAGEIALMRRSIDATERGLRAAMRAARPGMHEYQLKEIIEAEFRAAGARGLAFPSIVAAGRSSAVLHYTGGDGVIRAGDMILCDVGAEVDRYASDITRTFPVDGRFTDEQRNIYELVLRAQEAARAQLRPGIVYEDLHESAASVIRQAGRIDDFWHGLGHFVGVDVHDAGDYTMPLPAGAVLTLEPGVYLPSRGFGVRIEDEFLVTARGNEHLSRAIPRTVAEIEAATVRS